MRAHAMAIGLAVFLAFANVGPAFAATLILKQIAAPSDISSPVHAASPPGDNTRLFILDLATGSIRIFNRATGAMEVTPFFVGPGLGGLSGEQGAYALAFSPDYATTGKFYLSYADAAGRHVVEYRANGGDPGANVADPAYARTIITIPQPAGPNHYGGWIGFGPDGYLYITTGDGDIDPVSGLPKPAISQQKSNLLGAVLRIDVSNSSVAYSIPADNPFIGGDADDDPVWAYGLRNPFRASFDPVSGAMLIGDVGEDMVEEINRGAAGANYGWPGYEGSLILPDPGDSAIPYYPLDPADLVFPIYEYFHGPGAFEGISVTGGEFYWGPVSELTGLYLFGDLTGKIWSFRFDAATDLISELVAWDVILDAGVLNTVVSFATDGSGNLYILDISGGVWLLEGVEIPLPAAAPLFIASFAGIFAITRTRRRKPAGRRVQGRTQSSVGVVPVTVF